MLRLQVLGTPILEIDGHPVHLSRRKALALLVYLAVTEREHSRDHLALMFWSEVDAARAKMALRRALSDLNQVLNGYGLVTERDNVRFAYSAETWVDACAFREALRAGRAAKAIELYQGDFLTNFTLPDSSAFDEWQLFQTERYRQDYLNALQQVIQAKTDAGFYDEAIPLALRWINNDSLMMQPNMTLIQLYALSGRRSDAIRQYDSYRRLLRQELDAEPEAAIEALVETVRSGELRRPEPVTVEEEIRFVTVLAVGTNNPQLAAQIAERYQGEVVGQSPLQIVFGLHAMHEDDAERAAYAAFEIHQNIEGVTCGISSGMVTGKISGTALNQALWLQQNTSVPILASASTYRYLRRAFVCVPHGKDTYEVIHPNHGMVVDSRWVPLVGRQTELERLMRLIQQDSGHFVMLAGEAGIGKSRMIAELRRKFEGNWLEGRGTELRSKTSYAVLLDLLQSEDRGREIAALFMQLMRESKSSPEQIRYHIFIELHDFFTALAQQPTVLVIDDAHRADDLSLDFLAYLLELLPASRLFILCATRLDERPRLAQLEMLARQRGHYTRIELTELSEAERRELVASLLKTSAPLQADILHFAQGNPLFIEEIIRDLLESGKLEQRDGVWMVRETAHLSVPESLQSIILSRVNHLSPPLKAVIQRAAVNGAFFQPAVLKPLFPSEFDLNSALWDLEKAALIYRERIFPEERYAFKHVVIQNAIYHSLTPRHLSDLHGQIAQALETVYRDNLIPYYEQLAHHFSLASDDQKAIHFLLKAGEKARQTCLNHNAIDYLQNALTRLDWHPELAEADQIRFKILHHLGKTYYGLGMMHEAEICLQQALNYTRGVEKPVLINLYFWLAEAYHWQAKFDEEIEIGERGYHLLSEDEQETLEAALMNQTIAVANIHKGRWDVFRDITRRTAGFLEKLPYTEELRSAYMHVIELYLDTDFDQARAWLEKVESLAKQYHDQRNAAEVVEHRCWLALKMGDYEAGLAYAEDALAQYQKINDQTRIFRVMGHQTWLLVMSGAVSVAEKRAREALDYAEALQNPFPMVDAWLNLGYILLERQSDESESAFFKALDIAINYRLDWLQASAAFGLGWFYRQMGREDDMRHYLEMAQEKSNGNLLLTWCLRNISLTSFVEFAQHPSDAPEWLKRVLGVT